MKAIRSLPLVFAGLCFPALTCAQAGTTLLVRTDMNCNWKIDGQPQSPLKADGSTTVFVSPGEHLIEAASADGKATVRTKVMVEQLEKTIDLPLRAKHKQQMKMQKAEMLEEKTGIAPGPTWTDPATGLMWTRKDNGADISWTQATEYCAKMQLRGYHGWRLPAIDELQGIYDPSDPVPTKFDNGVTYKVGIKGHLKLTGWELSSTPGPPHDWPLHFVFDRPESPGGFPRNFTYSLRALCVRQFEQE